MSNIFQKKATSQLLFQYALCVSVCVERDKDADMKGLDREISGAAVLCVDCDHSKK